MPTQPVQFYQGKPEATSVRKGLCNKTAEKQRIFSLFSVYAPVIPVSYNIWSSQISDDT